MNDNVVPFDDQATIEREAREWLISLNCEHTDNSTRICKRDQPLLFSFRAKSICHSCHE